jgi:hypothetical protein
MKINLSKNVTGLKHDIIYNTKDQSIKTGVGTFWNGKRVEHLMHYVKINDYKELNLQYGRLLKTLKIEDEKINWGHFLGKKNVQSNFMKLIDTIGKADFDEYVENHFSDRLKLFERLCNFAYKGEKKRALEYNHSKILTGRASVECGFNLMTLKKDERKNLQSIQPGGAIIEIDIKSLEPRLYLFLIKGTDVEDAYSHLLTDVLGYNQGDIDRKDIKLAMISILYGASEHKIRKITALKTSDIRKIREYLDVDALQKRVISEFDEKGYFENAYGRKIYSKNAPVNYYIQSTAADFSCLVYERLLSQLPETGINLIGVIHDAVLLDVRKDLINDVLSITSCVEPIINNTAYFKTERHS